MASSLSNTSLSSSFNFRPATLSGISSPNSVYLSVKGKTFSSIHLRSRSSRLQVVCGAKPETVDKVCKIVRKQLALADDAVINGASKFSTLGADSLDTVEIVMGLEEEFGISVEEESAQKISTVQEAADMIENLISSK